MRGLELIEERSSDGSTLASLSGQATLKNKSFLSSRFGFLVLFFFCKENDDIFYKKKKAKKKKKKKKIPILQLYSHPAAGQETTFF